MFVCLTYHISIHYRICCLENRFDSFSEGGFDMFKRMLVLCAAFMFLFPSTAKASDWELKEDGYYYTGNRQNSDRATSF